MIEPRGNGTPKVTSFSAPGAAAEVGTSCTSRLPWLTAGARKGSTANAGALPASDSNNARKRLRFKEMHSGTSGGGDHPPAPGPLS